MRIWVNTVFILTSRKTEIVRPARGRKWQGPRAEDVLAESYLVQKIFGIWLQPITKFSVKVVNLGTIIDMQSWCKTWLLNGPRHIRAKQKLHRNSREACKSSWNPIGILKSFTLTISWNLAKCVKIFPGIISLYVYTTQIGNKWDCWESSAQSERRYLCSIVAIRSGWKSVGRFYGMFYLSAKHSRSLLMGRLHTKDVLENFMKDRLLNLVHWSSITLSLRKTSQESINWERKSYLDCSLDTLCTKGGRKLEGWNIGCRHWGVGNDGRIGNLLKKTQCKGSNISPAKCKIYLFPVADGRITFIGRDQELRTLTLIRDHPIRGEDQRKFLGESGGSPPPPPHDS